MSRIRPIYLRKINSWTDTQKQTLSIECPLCLDKRASRNFFLRPEMGHVRTWKPTGRQGPPSLSREFEQPVIARMIADVIEIRIVLEPEFLIGSEQRKTGLQQVDGPIELA